MAVNPNRLTHKEAAHLLGMGVDELHRQAAAGIIPSSERHVMRADGTKRSYRVFLAKEIADYQLIRAWQAAQKSAAS